MPQTLLRAGRRLALLGVLLLAGCATAPPWPDRPASAPSGRVLLDQVPFYPQERYQCGPASLAMMLNSQGLRTDPDRLKALVYLPGRQGSLQVEMVAAARAHDMVVYPLAARFDAILAELDAGHPVLVLQNLMFDWWPQWHFAVVVGYDAAQETVILNTDTREHYAMPYPAFLATWGRAERWAVVVLPPGQLPATARPLDYLRAAHDLESTGHPQAARRAYQGAAERWPERPEPGMALANLAFAQAQWRDAARQLIDLARHFPDYASGWNNLGFTLERLGCRTAASAALACAARLDPERFGSARLESGSPATPTLPCPTVPACPATSP
ncbi:PA2778 family cysteine peptidase [uncultured Marinobacter sp.]|uniref:PA2778 family cysteine peptidase n=1 Tax=uncultured Marinobacter sp. TaxID=187379 RepID=UPI0032B279E3